MGDLTTSRTTLSYFHCVCAVMVGRFVHTFPSVFYHSSSFAFPVRITLSSSFSTASILWKGLIFCGSGNVSGNFWPCFHCACTKTPICKLPLKIMTLLFNSAPPIYPFFGNLIDWDTFYCVFGHFLPAHTQKMAAFLVPVRNLIPCGRRIMRKCASVHANGTYVRCNLLRHVSLKRTSSREWSRSHLMYGFLGPRESAPKRHLDRLTHFCTAHPCAQHTDTQYTDTQVARYVRHLYNRPHFMHMSNYSRRAFSYAGPYAWKILAENVRKSTSIAIFFELCLKTFLFEQITHSAH